MKEKLQKVLVLVVLVIIIVMLGTIARQHNITAITTTAEVPLYVYQEEDGISFPNMGETMTILLSLVILLAFLFFSKIGKERQHNV